MTKEFCFASKSCFSFKRRFLSLHNLRAGQRDAVRWRAREALRLKHSTYGGALYGGTPQLTFLNQLAT
jgi:hypothetical protein